MSKSCESNVFDKNLTFNKVAKLLDLTPPTIENYCEKFNFEIVKNGKYSFLTNDSFEKISNLVSMFSKEDIKIMLSNDWKPVVKDGIVISKVRNMTGLTLLNFRNRCRSLGIEYKLFYSQNEVDVLMNSLSLNKHDLYCNQFQDLVPVKKIEKMKYFNLAINYFNIKFKTPNSKSQFILKDDLKKLQDFDSQNYRHLCDVSKKLNTSDKNILYLLKHFNLSYISYNNYYLVSENVQNILIEKIGDKNTNDLCNELRIDEDTKDYIPFLKFIDSTPNWDRSRLMNCLDYLNIQPVTRIRNKRVYNKTDYNRFLFYLSSNNTENLIPKSQICSLLNINYTTFETICGKLGITSAVDFGFGKDSKYYTKENKDTVENYINELRLNETNKDLYSIEVLSTLFDKDKTTINKVVNDLGISYYLGNFDRRLLDKENFDKLSDYFSKTEMSGISYGEKEIVEFIKSIYDGKIIENDRIILNGKELDIYIPSKNLAIEFDGVYWHSEMQFFARNIFDKNTLNTLKTRHLNKTKLCEQKGIRLIHINDILWNEKKDIYKSIISSALGIHDKQIYARKCFFEEIDNRIAYKFLDDNHLQGHAKSSKSFGLFYDGELVQVMTFQLYSNHNNDEVELNRMCTKKNTQVIGGFSKLMKNALIILNVDKITSYIDRSIYSGTSYKSIGFEVIKINQPTYKWLYKGKLYRREFSMKKNQLKRFNNGEQLYFDVNKTEQDNMIDNRIPRIWDCGTIKVEYRIF